MFHGTLTTNMYGCEVNVLKNYLKDLLNCTCQVSIERRVLDLVSEVMRGLCSISIGGKISAQDFLFSPSKASGDNQHWHFRLGCEKI